MLCVLDGGKAGLGPFDELVDTAVAGVTVSGIAVLTCCFGRPAGDREGFALGDRCRSCCCALSEVEFLVRGSVGVIPP